MNINYIIMTITLINTIRDYNRSGIVEIRIRHISNLLVLEILISLRPFSICEVMWISTTGFYFLNLRNEKTHTKVTWKYKVIVCVKAAYIDTQNHFEGSKEIVSEVIKSSRKLLLLVPFV